MAAFSAPGCPVRTTDGDRMGIFPQDQPTFSVISTERYAAETTGLRLGAGGAAARPHPAPAVVLKTAYTMDGLAGVVAFATAHGLTVRVTGCGAHEYVECATEADAVVILLRFAR